MSLNDLSDAVFETAVWIDVTRYYPPEVARGRVQSAPREQALRVRASVQPMAAKEIQFLPEGMRNQGTVAVYTKAELFTLKTSECDLPDQFDYRGVRYEVYSVEDWLDLGGYYKVIAVRRDR